MSDPTKPRITDAVLSERFTQVCQELGALYIERAAAEDRLARIHLDLDAIAIRIEKLEREGLELNQAAPYARQIEEVVLQQRAPAKDDAPGEVAA